MDISNNINNLMKEAQKMQQRMQDAQKELERLTVEGKAGGVHVTMNGKHDVLKVRIEPSLLKEEIDMLEDLVAAAVNAAVRDVEKKSREKISQLTAGMNIPPEFLKGEEGKN